MSVSFLDILLILPLLLFILFLLFEEEFESGLLQHLFEAFFVVGLQLLEEVGDVFTFLDFSLNGYHLVADGIGLFSFEHVAQFLIVVALAADRITEMTAGAHSTRLTASSVAKHIILLAKLFNRTHAPRIVDHIVSGHSP